ncbi:MAG: GxxExxY protein [Acidobacteria bacterium]|nr:GxxExxY protein [Acidobacteriota bacterium]
MNTNEEKIVYPELSYQIVGMAMDIQNRLGSGFLEKVYENALKVLLSRAGIKAEQQAPVKVYFDGMVIGDYYADILVAGKIILELKVVEKLTDVHRAQTLNYLKATGLRLAILINFGKQRLEHERYVN